MNPSSYAAEPRNSSGPISNSSLFSSRYNNTSKAESAASTDYSKGPDIVTVPNNDPLYNKTSTTTTGSKILHKDDPTLLAPAATSTYPVNDPHKRGFSKWFWCVLITLLLLVIAAVILIIFLVRTPSVSFDHMDIACEPSNCVNLAASGTLPLTAYFSVDNPNIVGADISGPVSIYRQGDESAVIGQGNIPQQHVSARDTTLIQVNLVALATQTSQDAVTAVVLNNQEYPIHVKVPLEIKFGLLHPTYTIDRDETIPPANVKDKIPNQQPNSNNNQ